MKLCFILILFSIIDLGTLSKSSNLKQPPQQLPKQTVEKKITVTQIPVEVQPPKERVEDEEFNKTHEYCNWYKWCPNNKSCHFDRCYLKEELSQIIKIPWTPEGNRCSLLHLYFCPDGYHCTKRRCISDNPIPEEPKVTKMKVINQTDYITKYVPVESQPEIIYSPPTIKQVPVKEIVYVPQKVEQPVIVPVSYPQEQAYYRKEDNTANKTNLNNNINTPNQPIVGNKGK